MELQGEGRGPADLNVQCQVHPIQGHRTVETLQRHRTFSRIKEQRLSEPVGSMFLGQERGACWTPRGGEMQCPGTNAESQALMLDGGVSASLLSVSQARTGNPEWMPSLLFRGVRGTRECGRPSFLPLRPPGSRLFLLASHVGSQVILAPLVRGQRDVDPVSGSPARAQIPEPSGLSQGRLLPGDTSGRKGWRRGSGWGVGTHLLSNTCRTACGKRRRPSCFHK